MEEKRNMVKEDICDFCGKKDKLYSLGKAKVCIICKHIHLTKKSFGKEVPAQREDFEAKNVKRSTYDEYLIRNKKKSIID